MPFNGSGVFNRLKNWVLEAAQGINILPDHMDTDTNDIAAGLSMCITKDGQQTVTADIPWNNFGITGLRNPTSNQDAANKQWVNTADSARSMGGFNLTNLADPVNPQDAATRAWVGGTTTALPDQTGALRKSLRSNGSIASWQFPDCVRSVRTSNTILGAADACTFVDITSGTFTQNFMAAATLGNGWYCFMRNSGTGDITLDPNASELIDGLTSYIMYPGEARLIQCDGTAFTSIVITPFKRVWTTSGTFITPPGYQEFGGKVISGGQSGQRTNNTSVISVGGNGGGAYPFLISSSVMGASQTITVGAGGAAVTGVAVGSTGGDSSIGSIIVIKGGSSTGGGAVNGFAAVTPSAAIGFDGVQATNTPHSAVWGGASSSNNASDISGNSIEGGAAGGGINNAGAIQAAGISIFAGNGGAASIASNGTAGAQPGGGGGATQTGTQSGKGGDGKVEIWGVV